MNNQQNEILIKVKEASRILSIPERTLKYRCKNNLYKAEVRIEQGKKTYFIHLNSMEAWAQKRYIANVLQSPSNNLPAVYTPNEDMPEEYKQIAFKKFELLAEYEKDLEIQKDRYTVKQITEDFLTKYNLLKSYPELFQALGNVSEPTLYAWRKTLKDNNGLPLSLAPKYKAGKQTGTEQEEALSIFIKLYLNPNRLRISQVYRMGCTTCKERNIVPPSERTVRRYIEDYAIKNADLCTLAREGEKKLLDTVAPHIIRDKDRVEFGDIFVYDGHVLNFQIINPITGKQQRMMMVVVYDYKTDMPLGFSIMPTEDTYSIASALRMAILRIGFKPRAVYFDNGRANKSKYFLGDIKTNLTGLFAQLEIKTMTAKPYNAKAKTIERFFGTFQEAERRMLTYTGISIADKPARLLRNEKLHREFYNKTLERITKGEIIQVQGKGETEIKGLTLFDAYTFVEIWFEEYINRPHSGTHFYKRQSPIQVFERSISTVMQQADFENRKISEESLRILMMQEKKAKLYNNGIRFRDEYYFNDMFYKYEKVKGKYSFIIKYDMFSTDSILVYDEQGQFLCEAQKVHGQHPAVCLSDNPEDRQKLQTALEKNSALIKGTKDNFKNLIEQSFSENKEAIAATEKIRLAKKKVKKEATALTKKANKRVNLNLIQAGEESKNLELNINTSKGKNLEHFYGC